MARLKTFTPHRLPLRHLNWESLVPLIGSAREAIARYDEALKRASPSTFERLKWHESLSSLRGQQIQTDLEEVMTFAKGHPVPESRQALLQKIVNAKQALDFGIQWKKTLNLSFFCKLHAIVKKDAPNPKEVGHLRDKQNWIGEEGCAIEEAYFYPPPHKKVRGYLQSLHLYLMKKEKDPVVQTAIFFAQLLIIHPFMDGNGRVARILIPLILWKKKLLSQPLLFLSAYFEDHRLDYFRKLFYISEHDAWEDWIQYFLKGVIEQSKKGLEFLEP